MRLSVEFVTLQFQTFPHKIDIAIIPTFSALSGLLGGTITYIASGPTQLSQKTAEAAVLGGLLGTLFLLAGLAGLAFR